MEILTCSVCEFPFTMFPFLSFSALTGAVFLTVGDGICLLCRLGGTMTELFGSTPLTPSSTLGNCVVLRVTLLRFGRPGQFASISGSDMGIVGELTTFSVAALAEGHVDGGRGGVKFLDTDLIISGDERTLVDLTFDVVVTAFVATALVLPVVSEEGTEV